MGGHFNGYQIHFQDTNFQSRHICDPKNRLSRLPLVELSYSNPEILGLNPSRAQGEIKNRSCDCLTTSVIL